MGKVIKRTTARLHLLTAREVQNAGDGDHSDGGGLLLSVRGELATWVFRFTSPNGRRREMGLGAAHRANTQQAGAGLNGARDAAHLAREQLRAGVDPIDARDAERDAHRAADAARKAKRDQDRLTLARCARQYHERFIEPIKRALPLCRVWVWCSLQEVAGGPLLGMPPFGQESRALFAGRVPA